MIDLTGATPDLTGLIVELRQQITELSDRCAVRSAELGLARQTVVTLQTELAALREQLSTTDGPAEGHKKAPRRNGAAHATDQSAN